MGDKLFTVKGKFKGSNTNNYGLFYLVIRDSTASLENSNVVVSRYSELFDNDISRDWLEFEALLADIKWEGKLATTLTQDLQQSFNNFTRLGTINDLIHYFRDNRHGNVQNFFETHIMKLFGEKALELELNVNSFTDAVFESKHKDF